jgi:hypothetical protein
VLNEVVGVTRNPAILWPRHVFNNETLSTNTGLTVVVRNEAVGVIVGLADEEDVDEDEDLIVIVGLISCTQLGLARG